MSTARRAAFVRLLTVDGDTTDRRRKGFNQAVFSPDGKAVWSATDLDMILEKYDRACRETDLRQPRLQAREKAGVVYRVGDPDPTAAIVACAVPIRAEDSDYCPCTWNRGHSQLQHVAGDGRRVVAVWPVRA